MAAAQARTVTALRKREDIERAALLGVLRQIARGVHESIRRAAVAHIEVAGDHGTRPAADAIEHRDVLLAVRALVGHGLPDDAGLRLELPKRLAGLRVDRL